MHQQFNGEERQFDGTEHPVSRGQTPESSRPHLMIPGA
jgi:hypothetical protein